MINDHMRLHSIDYRHARGELQRSLVNRGWWLLGTPRLIPLCRLYGHRPVVDGVDYGRGGRRSRWVSCDRCGIRLQQPVDSDLEIGQTYTDPIPEPSQPSDVSGVRGVIGGQLIIGPCLSGFSVEAKVGNMGSEQTLAGHLRLSPLGAIYVHTERHGTWMQRRLNPQGYESRVVGLSVENGRLRWQLWAKRDESKSTDPWWMRGSIEVDPRTILFGPARYSYEDVGEPQVVTVRMPHGDDHQVTVQLQRQQHGRKRLPSRVRESWTTNWDTKPGIPTKPGDRGRIFGSSETVTAAGAHNGSWPAEAAAGIAARMTRDRSRNAFVANLPAPP